MHIKVRVHTGAKKEVVEEKSAAHLAIWVKEKPEQNRANRRVLELVAAHYRVPANRVHLVSGHHAPSKILLVDSES